jgi:hypothetical protein
MDNLDWAAINASLRNRTAPKYISHYVLLRIDEDGQRAYTAVWADCRVSRDGRRLVQPPSAEWDTSVPFTSDWDLHS